MPKIVPIMFYMSSYASNLRGFQATYMKFVENVDTLVGSWYIVKWPIFSSKNAMELKFQFIFYMKGRYNAWVMHHIWIPYSNHQMASC